MQNPDTRTILALLQAHGFPRPETEYRFHGERRWRFDFAWPTARVALEKEGGIYQGAGQRCSCCRQPIGGAHRSTRGILRDIEKYNAATALAWHVVRQPPDRVLRLSSLKLHPDFRRAVFSKIRHKAKKTLLEFEIDLDVYQFTCEDPLHADFRMAFEDR